MFTNYAAYYDAARTLGLVSSPPGGPGLFTSAIQLTGSLGGRQVLVTRYIGKSPTVLFRAGLRPGLDLGLVVRPTSVVTWLGELAGATDVEVGDTAFDKAFAVRGDEPDRVKAFLTPRLRAALMPSRESPLTVDDHHVTLSYGVGFFGIPDDQPTVVRALQAVVAIANEMESARAATPPPSSVAPLVAQLAAFARDHQFTCAFDAPPRLVGRLGDLPVWIVARRRKKHLHDLEIWIQFPQPLGFSFAVATARTGVSTWLVGEDVQIGDPAVDRAFDLRSDAPERLIALLDADARRTLLELGQGRVLRLDETSLHLVDDARDFDPVALPALIERAADLMRSMARATRLPTTDGYR